jgi:hypothetical protein
VIVVALTAMALIFAGVALYNTYVFGEAKIWNGGSLGILARVRSSISYRLIYHSWLKMNKMIGLETFLIFAS